MFPSQLLERVYKLRKETRSVEGWGGGGEVSAMNVWDSNYNKCWELQGTIASKPRLPKLPLSWSCHLVGARTLGGPLPEKQASFRALPPPPTPHPRLNAIVLFAPSQL